MVMEVEKPATIVDVNAEKEKKMKKKKMIEFNEYIYLLLKQVHPKLGISSKAVKIIERLLRKTMVKIPKIALKSRKNPILLYVNQI